ncbi:MAG: thiamine pyrophosphate-dependent dehydrogenase E1 component subunit alpha [Verrucomicrobiaceae bacterium]|nr:MAG: thiamine pyrophosphate-dependent dehydrogenase E1 component subunit alpha [Verrucomicrobiaceae bacterium]
MLLARLLEEKIASLYRGGKITGGVFVGKGQEALSVSVGISLRKGDIFAPLIRDQAGRLAFGETVLDCTRTYMGSRLGPMRGRDGNVHRGRPQEGLLPMISHLGAMIPVVNGMLMGKRFRGESGAVGATCLGDGATSTGAFHEALNQAAVERLPLVLVVANNQYAYSTPNSRQFACQDLVDKAVGYGVKGHKVDATDLGECLRVVGGAIDNARSGGGPQLIVASLLRLAGHGEHDPSEYVDAKLRASSLGRDCLQIAEERLIAKGLADASAIDLWKVDAQQQVEEAVATTLREPAPDPNTEDWAALSTRRLIEGSDHLSY